MWMELQRPCPYCGGVPCLHKEYEPVPLLHGAYYLEANCWVECNCGMTSHYRKVADDAIDEFYSYEEKKIWQNEDWQAFK